MIQHSCSVRVQCPMSAFGSQASVVIARVLNKNAVSWAESISEGRKHDAGMLADSGLLHQLQLHAVSPLGQPMCIYGDPAYPLRVQLQAPYRNAILTADMQAFNTSMSEVRVAVEWLFGDIVNYFKFERNVMVYFQPGE